MWAQNATQSNDSIFIRDAIILEMIPVMENDYPGLLQTISVIFDLIASLLATIFTIRFYKQIEISHPLYAVIFMDIVISTASSYLVFILFWVNSIVDSDAITYLEFGFTALGAFNNVSSFMMIAFIRYYLLVHTKTNGNEEEIDMLKVTSVSLIMNSIVFIIILIIRGGLYIAQFIGYELTLELIASGFCLTILPLVTTLIINRKIDNFLKTEHDENNLNVSNSSTRPEEDKYQRSQKQSLEGRRWSDGKRKGRNPIILGIESRSTHGIQKAESNIANSRYDSDCKTKAGSFTSHYTARKSQKYGGIYVGETSLNSPTATNLNEKDLNCSTIEVNVLPNQVSIENEDEIHILELNGSSDDKTLSLHSNSKFERKENSNVCNLNIQNDTVSVGENKIEVLMTMDDAATNSSSPNMIFPSDPVDDTANEPELYSESREHKSILKFVTMTSILLFLSILSITFIRTFIGFNLSTIANVIAFTAILIFVKLCRTFLVIFSSIYCFELIHSLFRTIANETVEFFQLAHDRFIAYF